jgi:uncharacterized damage-inducible protein DinB
MTIDRETILQAIGRALTGTDAHVGAADLLLALDWKLASARPEGSPHSVFQLVNHVVYWQEWAASWLDGKRPRSPRHASGSWPGKAAPADRRDWERTVRRFGKAVGGLQGRAGKVDLLTRRGKWSPLEMLLVIGSHTSYHIGQITTLRQSLGAWPPPSGSVTW